MGQGLKHRLLGAVVLIGLLILLVPEFFSGGLSHPLVKDTELASPAVAPDVPAFVQELDTPPETVDVLKSDQIETIQNPENASSGLENGHLKVWTLQLATFSVKDNAEKLEQSLRESGYSSYLRVYKSGAGEVFYTVNVGSEVRAGDLTEVKKKLNKKMNMKGVIVRFTP